MYRKSLDRSNAYGFFDSLGPSSVTLRLNTFLQLTTELIQLEPVDLVDQIGILPVELDEVDIVGGGKEACEG